MLACAVRATPHHPTHLTHTYKHTQTHTPTHAVRATPHHPTHLTPTHTNTHKHTPIHAARAVTALNFPHTHASLLVCCAGHQISSPTPAAQASTSMQPMTPLPLRLQPHMPLLRRPWHGSCLWQATRCSSPPAHRPAWTSPCATCSTSAGAARRCVRTSSGRCMHLRVCISGACCVPVCVCVCMCACVCVPSCMRMRTHAV